MSDDYRIKFTIPDGPVDKQIEMVRDMRSVIVTLAEISGEQPDLTPFDEVLAKLEGESASVSHTPKKDNL